MVQGVERLPGGLAIGAARRSACRAGRGEPARHLGADEIGQRFAVVQGVLADFVR